MPIEMNRTSLECKECHEIKCVFHTTKGTYFCSKCLNSFDSQMNKIVEPEMPSDLAQEISQVPNTVTDIVVLNDKPIVVLPDGPAEIAKQEQQVEFIAKEIQKEESQI